MKTLGLIGGMSWESTVPYYRLINERIQQRLGGLHSSKLILHSVDFHDIANRLKNDYILCPDMRQRSIAGCYQNNVAWLYRATPGARRMGAGCATAF